MARPKQPRCETCGAPVMFTGVRFVKPRRAVKRRKQKKDDA